MSDTFWQAKIRGLLYQLNLNALKEHTGNGAEPFFEALEAIIRQSPELSSPTASDAHLISEASDRAVLNAAAKITQLTTKSQPLTVTHLLSGKELPLSLGNSLYDSLKQKGKTDEEFPPAARTEIDTKQLFWWLWRCLPQAFSQTQGEESLLMPAATILPDASLWSHASLTAAMAGALTGYERQSTSRESQSHPYLATFSFSPVQELIKASRKMRDFWAGSWVLHYLSAKICWKLANIYGPDSLIYPSLYQQPLIDHWLRQKWSEFQPWVNQPRDCALLTAGFPNVIVVLLPAEQVDDAMRIARQTLRKEWSKIGKLVFQELEDRRWTRGLKPESRTWNGWLKHQWQTYWSALPIGLQGQPLIQPPVSMAQEASLQPWLEQLNRVCHLEDNYQLFQPEENQFIQAVYQKDPSVSVNVGSWWPYLFDQLRFAASTVKSCRVWRIPTAFLPRSTISGLGSVVYPEPHQEPTQGENNYKPVTEGDTDRYWQRDAGLFDGIEELNASETLKRGLHRVLPQMLFPQQPKRWEERLTEFYPDLSSGVIGWLRTHPEHLGYFVEACQDVQQTFNWTHHSDENWDEPPANLPWGIPFVDENENWPNSRLLNAGWLIDDFHPKSENPQQPLTREDQKRAKHQELIKVSNKINEYFTPGNNPTDWYVLAAGDGDGMGEWLNGEKLLKYQDYMPKGSSNSPASDPDIQAINNAFKQLQQLKKRMGPSTHNALSRALLDFSNQLVPYLTERRYAGRLIYSGGDDVLAYTNLWEWDSWLWDIRECFRGADDPYPDTTQRFKNQGDYWQWDNGQIPTDTKDKPLLAKRPLFTMGHQATLSFGIVIAHHSVPLAIALENLWQAEASAKQHKCDKGKKDAVQVRVLFGNGNVLQATSKFALFNQWRALLNHEASAIDSALFEQAAQLWRQHPAPIPKAIEAWTIAFCSRRDIFQGNQSAQENFQQQLADYLGNLTSTTLPCQQDSEIQNWLKLTAFLLRNRQITLKKWQGQ
ncbi:type III-B CRISPR-associated protein Cas10/Cmr2 [Lyngbya aestuarii]|uniref:type III-B CRISPR-associated protein Cas10/Cmr2 n=1 Tax=Lyngbya aestuarii TaxID=118322 RepID=UPI00403DA737